MDMDVISLRRALGGLSRAQIAWFASRAGLRVLPALACGGIGFEYWRADKRKHLFSLFHALNASLTIAHASNPIYLPGEFRAKESAHIRDAAGLAAQAAKEAGYYALREWQRSARDNYYTYAAHAAYGVAFAVSHFLYEYANGYLGASAAAETARWYAGTAIGYARPSEEGPVRNIEAEKADLLLLLAQTDRLNPVWTDLWHDQKVSWLQEFDERLVAGLALLQFDYWVEEYQCWKDGDFRINKMEQCFFVLNAISQENLATKFEYLRRIRD
jgi:hypothetical protein